jgi:hypothetical protein
VKALSLVLQLLGTCFAIAGIGVVRHQLATAAETAAERTRAAARSIADRRTRFSRWWAHRRGRPIHVTVTAHAVSGATAVATATVIRPRVDRVTITDPEWLGYLDDRVAALQDQLDKAAQAGAAADRKWAKHLTEQRTALLDEISSVTRQGWGLLLVGLALSLVGTALGFWT